MGALATQQGTQHTLDCRVKQQLLQIKKSITAGSNKLQESRVHQAQETRAFKPQQLQLLPGKFTFSSLCLQPCYLYHKIILLPFDHRHTYKMTTTLQLSICGKSA